MTEPLLLANLLPTCELLDIRNCHVRASEISRHALVLVGPLGDSRVTVFADPDRYC